MNIDNSLA